jgi:hypothetical protein
MPLMTTPLPSAAVVGGMTRGVDSGWQPGLRPVDLDGVREPLACHQVPRLAARHRQIRRCAAYGCGSAPEFDRTFPECRRVELCAVI